MTLSARIGLIIAAALIVLGAAAGALAWRPAIAAIEPPNPRSFDPELVRRGRQLVALGNCTDCHTVRGGQEFAGGLPVVTPFGTVFSTNITPDPETGIGRWSEQAFQRAMKSGVDRAGQHLYPTFPYDHFTHVTDADDRALYAYLMTRRPVRAPAPANHLTFPYDQRPLIAGWKLLFLQRDEVTPDPAKSTVWNRGAYLVQGLAHCGACHTPRNALGAERTAASFAGGQAENWVAYALNAASPAPVPWTEDALFDYLRNGWQKDHGVARGPMAQVVNNLSLVDDDDVRAIAAYTADIFGPPAAGRIQGAEAVRAEAAKPRSGPPQTSASTSAPKASGPDSTEGAAIYVAACASCHETGRALPYVGVDLHLSTGINAPDPRNVANTILYGLAARNGERSPIMPGFAASMTDAQVTALLNYLRATFSKQPPWSNIAQTVADARQAQAAFLQTAAEPPNIAIHTSPRGQP
ncbi:fragment of putative Isoquinoline 1-oxidoreductase (part 1) [Bradyrhizobium sp. STM 3843]|uniref:cytochrome c n=1 Tax=Bradyrhizobium sp. STM 3843 TaxID=551947 RepID=UPI00024033C8|nr:cytochrome c [Bradyrhizobium sp. STM 3843]CCE08295.1 fragment of putative Isoquinoline 1-oxidoreductase (part 1) [Bradyrhizobium sp. STM 3843]